MLLGPLAVCRSYRLSRPAAELPRTVRVEQDHFRRAVPANSAAGPTRVARLKMVVDDNASAAAIAALSPGPEHGPRRARSAVAGQDRGNPGNRAGAAVRDFNSLVEPANYDDIDHGVLSLIVRGNVAGSRFTPAISWLARWNPLDVERQHGPALGPFLASWSACSSSAWSSPCSGRCSPGDARDGGPGRGGSHHPAAAGRLPPHLSPGHAGLSAPGTDRGGRRFSPGTSSRCTRRCLPT